jgi:homoserine kinase type II
MSVFTSVEQHELVEFLQHYAAGELLDYEGISDGVENTNYFVTTTGRQMVLTLFETHSFEEMGFFLNLMAHLSEHSIPGAHPVPDREQNYLRIFNNKPAALVERLYGASLDHPVDRQCTVLGTTLAQLHIAGSSFTETRANGRGHEWRMATAKKLYDHLGAADADMLHAETAFQEANRFDSLPGGVIHADLFRDNALWEGNTLKGIIDFYYACNDAYLYDLAVAANDWCVEADGTFVHSRYQALFSAYHAVRPVTADEAAVWPVVVRAAALRFWLSRLHDWHFPRDGEIIHRKDPDVFRRILQQRQQQECDLPIAA